MKFTIQERILLLGSLNQAKGNLTTLKVVKDFQAQLGFTEKEHEVLGLREENGKIHWVNNDFPPKEIKVGPVALHAALRLFKDMDAAETLILEQLPLYERLLKAVKPKEAK